MTSGGARNRSGPQADPNSLRSAKVGATAILLPGAGYDGEAPAFPLSDFSDRELALWSQAWTYPQAKAWAREPWRWNTVAMWVRTFVICEGSDATAADKGSLHRFADQIGLTPAGLKENGWAIAHDVVTEKRDGRSGAKPPSARDRMKVVTGGGTA